MVNRRRETPSGSTLLSSRGATPSSTRIVPGPGARDEARDEERDVGACRHPVRRQAERQRRAHRHAVQHQQRRAAVADPVDVGHARRAALLREPQRAALPASGPSTPRSRASCSPCSAASWRTIRSRGPAVRSAWPRPYRGRDLGRSAVRRLERVPRSRRVPRVARRGRARHRGRQAAR